MDTKVSGYCWVKHHYNPYATNGSKYTAHLYCNGQQRAEGDTSPCPAQLIDANNLGPPCEE